MFPTPIILLKRKKLNPHIWLLDINSGMLIFK